MSRLIVSPVAAPEARSLDTTDHATITRELGRRGVRFERWQATVVLPPAADQAAVLAAYAADVARLAAEGPYPSVDVVRLAPDPADPAGFAAKAVVARAKFLEEHTHAEDEVRFFVEGQGVFYLRLGGEARRALTDEERSPLIDDVCLVRCEQGDLISVPAGTRHWFDMGTRPHFCAIRLFGTPDGWVASFTGDAIAGRFPAADTL